jgi:hypothetical protein
LSRASTAIWRAMRAEAVVWSMNNPPGAAWQHALRPQHHLGQIIVIANAGDDHIGPVGGVGGIAACAPRYRGWPRHVRSAWGCGYTASAVSGMAQMAGDRPSHHAKSDNGNAARRKLGLSCRPY